MPEVEPVQGSIPMAVLSSAIGNDLEVMVDTATGYTYRGRLESFDAESMNVNMVNVTVTKVGAGFFQQLPATFIRGKEIVHIVLPRALQEQYTQQAKAFKKEFSRKVRESKLAARQAPPAPGAGKKKDTR